MRAAKRLLAITAGVLCCVVGLWFCTSIQGGQKTYELEPRLAIPEYKTDVARIMDAYERLMERYMDLTEGNLSMISMDVRAIGARLDSIDARLTRIEKVLDIEQPRGPSAGPVQDQPRENDAGVSLERAK